MQRGVGFRSGAIVVLAVLAVLQVTCADDISIVEAPSEIPATGTFTVRVRFQADAPRDIVVALRTADRLVALLRRNVWTGGSGRRVQLSIEGRNIPPGTPCLLRADIRERGMGRRTRMAEDFRRNIPVSASEIKAEPIVFPEPIYTPALTPAPTPASALAPAPQPELPTAPIVPNYCEIARTTAEQCANVCYRRVSLSASLPVANGARYSVRVTSATTGETEIFDDYTARRSYVRFVVYLAAGGTYRVRWSRGGGAMLPQWYGMNYVDDNDRGCNRGVQLVYPEQGFHFTQFGTGDHPFTYERPCPGVTRSFPADSPMFYDQCIRVGQRQRVIVMPQGGMPQDSSNGVVIQIGPNSPPQNLCPQRQSFCSLIERNSVWRYFDRGALPSTFRWPQFDDSSWSTGFSSFGSRVPQTLTSIRMRRTVYFRKNFQIDNISCFSPTATARVWARFDDGLVMYVNGVELLRIHMPRGSVNYDTAATTFGTIQTKRYHDYDIAVPMNMLRAGNNMLAVELHAREGDLSSADSYLDLLFLPGISNSCF
mmetsp:Transcript_5545/g.16540  ORF Transcript_5545/g.16540 Transcript_5545/m.16540 type:complete len:540 (+) Transcript_5545:85-1704(+)